MKTLLQWIFLLVSPILLSQTGGLKGTVLDESNGKPVPGINVVVKNTKYALSTDMDGNYIFRTIPAGTYEVEFSSMGYASKLVSEVIIKEKETVKETAPKPKKKEGDEFKEAEPKW